MGREMANFLYTGKANVTPFLLFAAGSDIIQDVNR